MVSLIYVTLSYEECRKSELIVFSFSYTEADQDEDVTPSKRKAILDKKEIISISDNSELAYSLGLEDEQGTFSILQFSAEESNDG